jgi:hypothetical protein
MLWQINTKKSGYFEVWLILIFVVGLATPVQEMSTHLQHKTFKWPRVLNVASTKSTAAIISPRLPFVQSFFGLSMPRHVLGPSYAHFGLVTIRHSSTLGNLGCSWWPVTGVHIWCYMKISFSPYIFCMLCGLWRSLDRCWAGITILWYPPGPLFTK